MAVEDLGGNHVPGSSVKLAIAPGTGTSGASLTCGTNPLTAASGTATFASCAVDLAGSGFQLTAKSGGLVGDQRVVRGCHGSAARLAFGVQPAGGVVASPFGAQPRVVVTDAGGNPVPNLGSPVSLSISSGTLSCSVNPVSTNAAGAAQFAGCEASNTGTFTLHASAPGLGSVDSAPFKLVNGAPLGVVPVAVPGPQTFGGAVLGRNPTSVTDDVNGATGALQLDYGDLTMAAVGESLTVNRAYNSPDTTGGAFGPGWSSLLDAGVTVAANGLTAVVRSADGQQLVYTSNGHGGWNPPPGARATLSCQLPLCTVTRFDGVSFQSIGGKIQNYLSPNGIGLHFIYTAGHLSQITGSAEALALGMQASLGEEIGTLAWSGQSSGTTQNLNALAVIDSKHVWAVGSNCTLEMTTNGSTWTKDTNVTGCAPGTNLTAIATNSGDGPDWAVGTGGTILVCTSACSTASAAWKALSGAGAPPATVNFTSLWEQDSNRVYAVGTTATGAGQLWACSSNCKSPTNGPGRRGVGQRDARGPHGDQPQLDRRPGRRPRRSRSARTARSSPAHQLLDEPRRMVEARRGNRWLRARERDHVQLGVGRRRKRRLRGRLGAIWACSARCNNPTTGTGATSSVWKNVTPPGLGSTVLTSVIDAELRGLGGGRERPDLVLPDELRDRGDRLGLDRSARRPECTRRDRRCRPRPRLGGRSRREDRRHEQFLPDHRPARGNDRRPRSRARRGLLARRQPPGAGPRRSRSRQDRPRPPAALDRDAHRSEGAACDVLRLGRLGDARPLGVDADPRREPDLREPRQPGERDRPTNGKTQFATGDTALSTSQFTIAGTAYDASWKLDATANGSGQGSHTPLVVLVSENNAGEVTQISTPTRSVNYSYTSGALTGFTDANGNTWTYAYKLGLLTGVNDPSGNPRLTVSYTPLGRVLTAPRPEARRISSIIPVESGDQTSTRTAVVRLTPGVPTTTAPYLDQYSGNALIAEQLPDGATTSYSYDSQLDAIELQDPLGRITTTTYSPAGDLLKEATPLDGGGTAVASFTYDGLHEPAHPDRREREHDELHLLGPQSVQQRRPGPSAGATHYLYNYLGETSTDGPTGIVTFT